MFLVTLAVLKSTSHVYCRMFLFWNLSGVFLIRLEVMGFREGDHSGKVPFLSHHINSMYCEHDL